MTKPKSRKAKKQAHKARRARKRISLNSNLSFEDQLKQYGLCIKDMRGDGNCLFRALSDQFYGDDKQHKTIRQEVCQFLRDHEEEYKYFVEDDRTLEQHVSTMEMDGTYGGNMELAAFARMKGINIRVYQPGMVYVISGTDGQEDDEETRKLHIAYHSWEHYSSIRNIDGPFTGPPEIKDPEKSEEESPVEESEDPLDSKEKVVLSACPDANMVKIRRLLRKYKGDTDKVIDALYEEAAEYEEKEEKKQPDQRGKSAASVAQEKLEQPEQRQEQEQKGQDQDQDQEQESREGSSREQPANKPKRISAREKKRLDRMRRKENQRVKKQGGAMLPKTGDDTREITHSMKEMYV